MKFEDGYGLKNLFYDGNTDELCMLSYYGELMYPRNPDMSGKDIHCKVYKYRQRL